MHQRDLRGTSELPTPRRMPAWVGIAAVASGLFAAACSQSAAETPPESNVAAAALAGNESPPSKKKAKVDPAALYDPPTADVEPPEVAGKRQSAPDFPDVVLTDQDGKEVRFYDELVKGKIVFINFMYATCTGT